MWLKIAVSASGSGLDALIDPRFGRCPYFVVVDTETMQFEDVPNTSQYAPSGAGIGAAQAIASRGVQVVLTGSVGPNAYQALSAAGIQIMTGVSGTVREAVARYRKEELGSVSAPAAGTGYGIGGGFGIGRGGGRGTGRGRGMGMRRPVPTAYPTVSPVPSAPQMTNEQEAGMLRSQVELLQKQFDQIKERLKELERR